MDWIDFPDERLQVNGLWWWEETRPDLWRLPARMQGEVPGDVWGLAQQPSGARIRFATDADALSVRAFFPSLNHMNNMPRIGQMAIELWVNGEYWRPVFPVTDSDHELDANLFDGMGNERKEICLYLGLYAPVLVRQIGFSQGATIEPPAPFAVGKPVAYYGSSIDQGGCASRPSMSYQAILSRDLNLDFINLGFSGAGRGEPALARAMAEIDASCFVIVYAQNVPDPEDLERTYGPFLQTIRDSHPQTPIVCVTPIFSTSEILTSGGWNQPTVNERRREVIRAAYTARVELGDANITLVEGYDLLGPDDREGLIDLTHPNDIGFVSMAKGLSPVIRKAVPRV